MIEPKRLACFIFQQMGSSLQRTGKCGGEWSKGEGWDRRGGALNAYSLLQIPNPIARNAELGPAVFQANQHAPGRAAVGPAKSGVDGSARRSSSAC
jgi:hypothetical protein